MEDKPLTILNKAKSIYFQQETKKFWIACIMGAINYQDLQEDK
jgi:hypothetical protein